MKKRLLWFGFGVALVALATFIACLVSRPDYRETLTAVNELRSVLPQASRPQDFARERNRLDGLLGRDVKHFSHSQRDAVNQYRFAISLLATDMGMFSTGGVLDQRKLENVQTSAERAAQALNQLEAALR